MTSPAWRLTCLAQSELVRLPLTGGVTGRFGASSRTEAAAVARRDGIA